MSLSRMRLSRLGAIALVAIITAACGNKPAAEHVRAAKAALEAKDTKTATIEIKNALQINPDLAEARFMLGSILLKERNPAAAEVELRKALAAGFPLDLGLPPLAEALIQLDQAKKLVDEYGNTKLTQPSSTADLQVSLSKAYWALGKADASQLAQDAALAAVPDFPPALLLKARKQAFSKDLAGALETTERLLAKDANLAEAWKLKGDISQSLEGKAEQALAAYEAAVKADPGHVPAHLALFGLHLKQGNTDAAGKDLDNLKRQAPRALQTRLLEVQLALHKREFKQARGLAQQLVTSAPNNAQVLQVAGNVELNLNSPQQAENHLEAAHRIAPNQPGLKRLLIAAYLRGGKTDRALAMLNALPDKDLPDPAMLSLAGEVYLASGNAKQAEAYFRRALKFDPNSVTTRTAVAVSQFESGQVDQGISSLSAIASEDSGSVADLALISAYLARKDHAKALEAVDRLERKQPDKPTAANLRGRIHLARKDVASARKAFEQALTIDPGFFAATASLASLDVAEGNPQQARQRFEALLAKNPSNAAASKALAMLAVRSNAAPEEVAGLLSKAIAANPDDVSTRGALIELHIRGKDYKQALLAAQAGVAAAPNSTELLAALGRAQYLAGDANQAKTTFNRLVTLMPLSELPHLQLAELNLAAEDLPAATQNLKRALELKPDSLTAQRRLVLVSLMANDFPTATKVAQIVQQQRPDRAAGFLLEGDVLAAQQKWEAAVATYRRGLKQTNSPEVAAKLHATLKAQVSRAEADRFAAAWLASHARDSFFLEYLGDAAMADKNFAEAASRFKSVLALHPDHAVATNNLAWASLQTKSPDALKLAERANQLAPDQPAFMDTLAWVLADRQDFDRAIPLMRRAVSLQPSNADLQLSLAKLLIQAGQKPQAKVELEKLSKLGSKFGGRDEVRALLKGL